MDCNLAITIFKSSASIDNIRFVDFPYQYRYSLQLINIFYFLLSSVLNYYL